MVSKRKRASIPIVSRSEADGRLGAVYRRVAGASGEPANILAVHSLHPQTMEDHARLYRTLMFSESPLSRLQRELIATVVSRANSCHY